MRAYSQDLRQRIVQAVDQGKPQAEVVKTFHVSLSTIKRYLKLRRETGDIKPKTIPGRPSKKGAALQAGLLSQLEAHSDATLAEHCQFWEATHGIHMSSATMSRAIKRLNWTRKKKTIRASEQNEADRAAWREQAKTLETSKLVFIDECGSNIALTRLYARSRHPGNASMARFHGTGGRISRCSRRFPFKGWAKPFSWKGQRILPSLRSLLNRSSLQVYLQDTLSSWIT